MRNLKNLNKRHFLNDLFNQNWTEVSQCSKPNEMWTVWKEKLMIVIDKYAPIRQRRIGNKRSPWITPDLLRKMYKRDFLKSKAEKSKDPLI